VVFCPLRNIGFLEGAQPSAAEFHLRPTGSRTPDSRCSAEDKRSLCQLSSKRLADNWYSGLLSSAKHRLSGRCSADCRRVNHLRPTGSQTPDSRCFAEDKRPLCQLCTKRLEDDWHSGRLSSAKRSPFQRVPHGGRNCLCVLCVGPLCGPPFRWWVLCGALLSVWVPCVGPLRGSSRRAAFHVASTRVMSPARSHAPA